MNNYPMLLVISNILEGESIQDYTNRLYNARDENIQHTYEETLEESKLCSNKYNLEFANIGEQKTYYRKLLTSYLDIDTMDVVVSFITWDDIKIGDCVDVQDTSRVWYICLVTDVTKISNDTIVSIHYIGWCSGWDETLLLSDPRIQYPTSFSTKMHTHVKTAYMIDWIDIQIEQYVFNHTRKISGRVIDINKNFISLNYCGRIYKINYEAKIPKIHYVANQWYAAYIYTNFTCPTCNTFYRQIDCYCKKCGLTCGAICDTNIPLCN